MCFMKYKNYTVFEMKKGEEKVSMMYLKDVKIIVKESKKGCTHCECICNHCEKCGFGN